MSLCPAGNSGPPFLDGIANGKVLYRLYRAATSTSVYAEKFTTPNEADDFCRSVGGSLAAPSAPQEYSIATLLNGTLAYMVKYNYGTDADFNMWMGLKRVTLGSDEHWITTSGTGLPQPWAWADQQPKQSDNVTCAGACECSVLGWYWSE
jgi:hypothetical protein